MESAQSSAWLLRWHLGVTPTRLSLPERRSKRCTTPRYIEADWTSGQCLGWQVNRDSDHVFHGHGGGIHGFASQISFNLPAKTGVIVLANAWPIITVQPLAQELIQIAVGGESAIPSARPTAIAPPPESPEEPMTTPAEMEPYLGSYFAEPGMPPA